MKTIESLSLEDRTQLLMAPVYITLHTAASHGELDEADKNAAVKLNHLRAFASPKGLKDFYHQVELEFEADVKELDEALPKDPHDRKVILEYEIAQVEDVLVKLDPDLAQRLRESFQNFAQHALKEQKSVVEDFILPLDIKGLTA